MWSLLTAGVRLVRAAVAAPSLAVLELEVAADLPRRKFDRHLLVDALVVCTVCGSTDGLAVGKTRAAAID